MRISDWSSDVCSSDLRYSYHWQSASEKLLRKLANKRKRKQSKETNEMHEHQRAHDKQSHSSGAKKAATHHGGRANSAPEATQQKLAMTSRLTSRSSSSTTQADESSADTHAAIANAAASTATTVKHPVQAISHTVGGMPVPFPAEFASYPPMAMPNVFYYPQLSATSAPTAQTEIGRAHV